MKRFEELTPAEKLELTDEEIERFVDIECALAGAPLLPEWPEGGPVHPDDIVTDRIVYEIGGYTFSDEGEALAIRDLINASRRVRTDYNSSTGYKYKYVEPCSAVADVTAQKVFSPELFEQVRARLSAYKTEKDLHDSKVSDYKSAQKARKEASGWVWEEIYDLRRKQQERDQMQSNLDHYRDLAGGDEAIAKRFLLKAYPDASEILVDIDFTDVTEPITAGTEES